MSSMYNSFCLNGFSRLCPYKYIRNHIRHCQTRITICANLVGPTLSLLHTSSQGLGSLVPETVIFIRFFFFTLNGHDSHLGHVCSLSFLCPGESPYEIGVESALRFQKKCLKTLTDDGRTHTGYIDIHVLITFL